METNSTSPKSVQNTGFVDRKTKEEIKKSSLGPTPNCKTSRNTRVRLASFAIQERTSTYLQISRPTPSLFAHSPHVPTGSPSPPTSTLPHGRATQSTTTSTITTKTPIYPAPITIKQLVRHSSQEPCPCSCSRCLTCTKRHRHLTNSD